MKNQEILKKKSRDSYKKAPSKRKIASKKWVIAHREEINKISRNFTKENSERSKLRSIKYRKNNLEKYKRICKNSILKKMYKITLNQFNLMLKKQKNKCAICPTIFTKTPHVDHDHITGEVRALLCAGCNSMLGHAKDNPKNLRAGALYIEKHKQHKRKGETHGQETTRSVSKV